MADVFQTLAVTPYLPRVDLPFIEHHWHSDLGVPRWPSATDGAEHVAFLNARWGLLTRSACDGTALPPKGLALKRRLVAAQRRAAAERHPSILDAMHRLGLVTGGTREQRDAAWVEGRWVEEWM